MFETSEFLINDKQDAAAWTSLCFYETIQASVTMFYSRVASVFELFVVSP